VCFRNIYILPGIPKLMATKFDLLADRFEGPALFVGWLEVRAAEAEICHDLEAIVAAHPDVVIGSYPRREDRGWQIRVTAQATSAQLADTALGALKTLLGDRVMHHEHAESTR
jgi:molybdopterin-biosynthesis enzyme MoeA-like protein